MNRRGEYIQWIPDTGQSRRESRDLLWIFTIGRRMNERIREVTESCTELMTFFLYKLNKKDNEVVMKIKVWDLERDSNLVRDARIVHLFVDLAEPHSFSRKPTEIFALFLNTFTSIDNLEWLPRSRKEFWHVQSLTVCFCESFIFICLFILLI